MQASPALAPRASHRRHGLQFSDSSIVSAFWRLGEALSSSPGFRGGVFVFLTSPGFGPCSEAHRMNSRTLGLFRLPGAGLGSWRYRSDGRAPRPRKTAMSRVLRATMVLSRGEGDSAREGSGEATLPCMGPQRTRTNFSSSPGWFPQLFTCEPGPAHVLFLSSIQMQDQ